MYLLHAGKDTSNSMGLFFFYNNRKPRKFDHKPIFYDPKKESLEKQIIIKRSKKNKKSSYSSIFGNVCFFLIFILLVMLAWYLFLK